MPFIDGKHTGPDAALTLRDNVEEDGFASQLHEWYVGMTPDLNARFNELKMPMEQRWHAIETTNPKAAVLAVNALSDAGFDADVNDSPGGVYVYAVKMWPELASERQAAAFIDEANSRSSTRRRR